MKGGRINGFNLSDNRGKLIRIIKKINNCCFSDTKYDKNVAIMLQMSTRRCTETLPLNINRNRGQKLRDKMNSIALKRPI